MTEYNADIKSVETADGLPIVQPTRSRVDEFLTYTDREPDESLGRVPPQRGAASVKTIAANAVMAGCRPEYFPIVLAAIEGMLREEFNAYGVLSTTHPSWPVVMVNGPLTRELEINAGTNLFGQGFQANTTIGRTISLVAMNVGGSVPGRTDAATHGAPHKFGLCFAENEERNPWEPYHVEQGYDSETSTVTVFGAENPWNIHDNTADDAPGILTSCTQTMASIGSNLMYYNRDVGPHLSLCPEHARIINDDGWTKTDVKRFVYDQARLPKYLWEGRGLDRSDAVSTASTGTPWATHFNVSAAHQMIGMCETPEDVTVTVTGGTGHHSVYFSSFSSAVPQTVPITLTDGTPVTTIDEFRNQ